LVIRKLFFLTVNKYNSLPWKFVELLPQELPNGWSEKHLSEITGLLLILSVAKVD